MKRGGLWTALMALSLLACGGSTNADGSGGGTSSGGSSASSGSGGSGAVGGSGGVNTGGTTSSFKQCTDKGTCVLYPTNCCGYCDVNAKIGGYEAINQQHEKEYAESVCSDEVLCPGCATAENPNNLALCRGGSCVGVDLRTDELSACKTADDCRLRWTSRCCESCSPLGPDELISYNKNVNLEAEVCSPLEGACPPCAPPDYPTFYVPTCVQGHCGKTLVGP